MDYEKEAQEIADSLGVTLEVTYKGEFLHFAEDREPRHVFDCTLIRGDKKFSFDFGQSYAAGQTEPTMYDILGCLQKDEPEYIEDEETLEKVQEEYENMTWMFDEEELELLREIN